MNLFSGLKGEGLRHNGCPRCGDGLYGFNALCAKCTTELRARRQGMTEGPKLWQRPPSR